MSEPLTRREWSDSPVETAVWRKSVAGGRVVTTDDMERLGWMRPTVEARVTFDQVEQHTKLLREKGLHRTAYLVEQMFHEIVQLGCALDPEPEPHPWGVDP